MTDLLVRLIISLKKSVLTTSRMEMLVESQVGCYLMDNLHILGVIINQPFNLLKTFADELPKTQLLIIGDFKL